MSLRLQSSVAVAACLLLVLCSHLAGGAVLRAIADTNPDYPNSCWLKDVNKTIPVGGSLVSENNCEKYFCESGSQLELKTHTCGAFATLPGCDIVRDLSKPFPDCCGGDTVCN